MPRSLIHRLADDVRGVSAVEFALIAPVMILFYAGLVDLAQAYMALKRTSHVAAAVADLVSQSRTITKANINSIFEVGPPILSPFESTLEQRVSSVTRTSATKYTLNWSENWASPGTKPADRTLNAPLDISGANIPPALFKEDGDSVIFAEANYTYKSPFQAVVPEVHFKRQAYLSPRTTNVITCTDC